MPDCVFCNIVRGKIPSQKEYEDEEVVVFKDIHPSAPVHLVVIPKKHIPSLIEADRDDQSLLGKMQLVIKSLALQKRIDTAYKIALNGGRYQEVPHIHYHLLGWPREE